VFHKRQVVCVLTLFVSKASPGASHQQSLTFLLNHYLYGKLDCVLSLYELISTVDALCLTFQIVLDYPFSSYKPLANVRCSCKDR
jgi:hypothetical protein